MKLNLLERFLHRPYRGQAFFSKTPKVREHLIKQVMKNLFMEWCTKRLEELGGKKSILDPLYYAGSFTLGSIAGLIGDGTSLGFVEETEKQVVEHLKRHLNEMSPNDKKVERFLEKMLEEEEMHGQKQKNMEALNFLVLLREYDSYI